MIIDRIEVIETPDDIPDRIHMAVSDGIELNSIPRTVVSGEHNEWNISYYNEYAITFYSSSIRHEISANLIGNRTGADLLPAYRNYPYYQYYQERFYDPYLKDLEEDYLAQVPWEGAFNTGGGYGMPVYPVTILAPDNPDYGLDLFMPVSHINDALSITCNWQLQVAEIPAYCGEIIFELVYK